MTVTNPLISTDCPLPIVPTLAQRSAADSMSVPRGTFSPFNDGTSPGAEIFNKLLTDLANAPLLGLGIASGFALDNASGLSVTIASGIGYHNGVMYYAGGSLTATDDARTHIWLLKNGTLDVSLDTDPPTDAALYLGSALAGSGAITELTNSGVMYARNGSIRYTADVGEPLDSPPDSLMLHTLTAAGHFQWNGEAHKPIGISVNVESIGATKTLVITDAERQILTPTGAHRTVLMPSSTRYDKDFTIVNGAASGSYNVVVKDSTNTTTLATLTNGQSARTSATPTGEYVP